MKKTHITGIIATTGIIMFILLLSNCRLSTKEKTPDSGVQSQTIDFSEIKSRGTLNAGVSTNSTDYFVYRGKPMGFQLELLQSFTHQYGLELNIIVENDLIKSTEYLKNREIDILAQSLTVTPERDKLYEFTRPIAHTRQVLIQKRNPADSIEFISNQLDLAGKTVHIQKGGAAYDRLANLSEEIADTIYIKEVDSLEMEEIIRLVANGDIAYAVCDENVALINKKFYNNIDISTPVSFPQKLAWAVREESTDLKDSIDLWLKQFKKTASYKHLYNKYFKSRRATQKIGSKYYSGHRGHISIYDHLIKKYSEKIDWDWRLLASLMFQESRFNPEAVSWAGAYGVMQLMPETAESLGVNRESSVESHIAAGVEYLGWLEKRVADSVPDKMEKIKFVLAAYNVGYGHVEDAIRLTEKYGKNPGVWDNNVRYFLLHKSSPKYFDDEVVRNGYCSGTQPVKYVDEITERYEHYLNVIPVS